MIYEIKTIKIKLKIKEDKREKADEPLKACGILKSIFAGLDADQEHMVLLSLDSSNQVKGYKVISSGGQSSADPDMRVIFRNAILLGANSIILAHNHPSGNSAPSSEDWTFTKKVKEAGNLLSIEVLDHIIIGEDCYSFTQGGNV